MSKPALVSFLTMLWGLLFTQPTPATTLPDTVDCASQAPSCPRVEFVITSWGSNVRSFLKVVDIADATWEIWGKNFGAKGSTVTVLVTTDTGPEALSLSGTVIDHDEITLKAPPLDKVRKMDIAVVAHGQRSRSLSVAVRDRNEPYLAKTTPDNPLPGANVRIEGASFTPSSKVELEGESLPTTFMNPTALEIRWPDRILEGRLTVHNGEVHSEFLAVRGIAAVRGTLRLPVKIKVPPSQVTMLDHADSITPDRNWRVELRVAGHCTLVQYGRLDINAAASNRYYGQALVDGDDVSPMWDPLGTAVAVALLPRFITRSGGGDAACIARQAAAALPSVKALAAKLDQDMTADFDYVQLLNANKDLVIAAITEAAHSIPAAH